MKCVPPASGTSPIPANPGTRAASAAAMRMSHATASESPAPAHTPLTAAITGFSSARIATHVRVVRLLERRAHVRHLLELGQILARAEAAAGTGEDDRAHLRVRSLLQRGAQCSVHRAVERVEHVRTIQRDRLDAALAGDFHLGHRVGA